MDITLPKSGIQNIVSADDLLAAWADFLRLDVAQGDASPRTIATYQAQVRDFLAWCEAQGLHPALATEDDLKAYRAHLTERYARATVAIRLAAVRRFYQAAVWRGYRADNPAAGIRPPRERTARDERVRFLPLEGLKETDVLTAIATIGCASAITLANLTLALMAFLRARERQANGQAGAAMMTPPQVVVIPPMQVQTPPLLPQGAPPSQLETVKPRHFTIVGEDDRP